MKRPFWVLTLVLAFSILGVKVASAQQPTPSDDQVNAIARQLFCPVCQNTPLDVCPTEACHQWRELIRQMLAEGKSEATIKQYFVDNYGARVLSEPPPSGFNWLIYIVPPVAFLAGAYLLYLAFRTWKRTGQASASDASSESRTGSIPGAGRAPDPAASSGADDDYAARLEEELRKRR